MSPPLTGPSGAALLDEFVGGAEPGRDVGAVNIRHLNLEVPGARQRPQVFRVVVDGHDAARGVF